MSTALVGIGLLNAGFANAVPVSGQGTWETTLQGRDLDGNLATFEAYYDTTLDITWLANANYAGMPMDWISATAWVENLNPYGNGIAGWRLPTVTDTGTAGCDFAYTGTDCGYNVDTATGEMASLFYVTLGNLGYFKSSGEGPQPGWGLTNTGPFSKIESGNYWSAKEYAPDTSRAWQFDIGYGLQAYEDKTTPFYVWAVHAGDVGVPAVPVPAAAWLFGSGLLGLIGVARRNCRWGNEPANA
ncbi:MAG: DUF1566 domain-containing protein [Gammaproteobacteria bacterium]|nr:DUF1566 domain-containing protein [Gammaproteobacteria bacterium]